jgi:hypothetical protein
MDRQEPENLRWLESLLIIVGTNRLRSTRLMKELEHRYWTRLKMQYLKMIILRER